MYRFHQMLSVACCLSLLAGCYTGSGTTASTLAQIKIGVTVYTQDDTFISTVRQNIEQLAKERETQDGVKITLNVQDGRGNQSIQNDQVDKFIAQGYDVICVNEVDRTNASVIIDKARAADIPVVFFNREPVEEDMQRWDKVYYVGSIPREAGEMQGTIVADLYEESPELVDKNGDGKLQYVMLEGEPGHQDAAVRTEYCIKKLTSSGIAVEKLANETANWQRSQAYTKMTQWLENPEISDRIEVVFSNNDDMALGAIDAYAAAEITALPVIIGMDAIPPALEAVRAGTLTGTVRNDGRGQAEAIFNIAYALATGADVRQAAPRLVGKYFWTPHSIVTIGNVMQEAG